MANEAGRNDQEQEFQLMISRQITRFKKFVADSNNNSKITEIYTRMQRMELIFDEFNKVQTEIEQYDESEQNFSERVTFEDDYYETVAKAKKFVGQFETFNVKLPPLSLPEFDGSYDKWLTFYDAFSALIHNNPNLDRINTIRKLKACTNCLRLGHKVSNCQGSSCRICDKKHNSLLHLSITNKNSHQNCDITDKHNISNNEAHASVNNSSQNLPIKSDEKRVERNDSKQSVVACAQNILTLTAYDNDSFVLLTTALLKIEYKDGESMICRALLDAGSQSNFISQELFERLNIQGTDVHIKVIGINGNISFINNVIKSLIKSINSNYNVNLQFLVSNQITTDTPHMDFDTSHLKIPNNIDLADPQFNESSKVDILLGAGIFYRLLLPGQISLGKGRPILQNTELGWIVAGTISCPSINNRNFSVCNLSRSMNNLENGLEKFWLIEEIPSLKNNYTEEENEVESHFQQTYSRDNYGNFIVRLPFRDNLEQLGESYDIAVNRFQSLERKLGKNPTLEENYSSFINECINLGHMSELNNFNFNLQPSFFLPHHAVIKESSMTTRLRVVFDASSKSTSSLSLNDILKTGPCIQDTLFFILLRFRLFPIVVSADIAKMYRCVKIHENDTKFQLILWRNNTTDPLKIYKLLTVTYGMSPASFLATRCLKQLALDNEINHPEAAQSILKDFYMDDYLVSVKDIKSACFLMKDVYNILLSGGFRLRQWSSNNEQILNFVSQLEPSTKTDYIIKDEQSCSKTLGTVWNFSEDILKYVTNPESGPDHYKIFTKRRILSVISQIFDILGLKGPVITRAKLFMQKLWGLIIGWDDPVPDNVLISWLQFYNSLKLIEKLKISRHILITDFISIEMHVFTDASQYAYGTPINFRSMNSLDTVNVNLVCSKSRVAPLKVISIPRLELCAALLGVELAHTVIKATENEIKIDKIFYWCDSTIVLAWISSESSKLKTFVANRVSKIQTFSHSHQWRYISTDLNPADYISRGVHPGEIQELDSWFFGPKFLSSSNQYWPNNIETQSNTDLPELKQPPNKILLTKECVKFDVFYKYSSFNKCIRIIAYLLRFKNNLKVKPKQRDLNKLKISELDEAKIILIKHFQRKHFAIEIKDLLRHKQVSKKSKLFRLSVFLDERGIIRVGGRLKNTNLNFDNKHPIILPAKCHLTSLIVRHFHFKYLHAGPQTLLSVIRQNYWPMQGRNSVRGILRKCVICFKVSPSAGLQKMGDLPSTRVQPSRIFSVLGVDYTGPFLIKNSFLRNTKSIKAWICIFICFASKAIHIELVTELSTNSFLNAFKRLIARRGFPSEIYSDNGSNFVGASNLINEIKDDVFRNFLIDNRIIWHFIPPRSPHHGGLWESAVRLTKYHLKRVLQNTLLTYENFYSLLVQIESIVNSRPLTPLSEDPDDSEVLTPGHFIIGAPLTFLPENSLDVKHSRLSCRYKQLRALFEQFWRSWSRSYLQTLQERPKWQVANDIYKVGQCIVLHDDAAPLAWKIGRIMNVHPGADGHIRVVTVKVKNAIFKRPVTKISVLPIYDQS
ncbi:uncharacterized protein LOC130902982 [Diorhabda carinulata]|uniref:uncharacterized protein LOC130902982 n=1 Tax=Diorhabda carinulata TaxID=1163345 RepID=UPI0025A1229D|nr:uncharacterized protein LOC130902982 [Diorhabda carinulata]